MAAPPSDSTALAEGTVLDGRYRLTQRIGRGGFAWVYEAEHIDLGRAAAVKLLDLPTTEASADFVERFLREARIIARLNHPNVVSVYDFGLHASTGQPYIAMELLQGHDLEHELAVNGPVEPVRAQKLFVGAAEALRLAHANGVVHKDLKPSNLFIADPGTNTERMVLLDFGIAWALEEGGRLTKDGGFTGTPAYVAPEYARHLLVSPAVDVYQLGLILSEALSCTPCVRGISTVQLILAHCQGELAIPDQVKASPFGPIVARATATDASARYHDGGAMADALALVDATAMIRLSGGTGSTDAMTAEHLFSMAEDGGVPTLVDEPVEEPVAASRQPERHARRQPDARPPAETKLPESVEAFGLGWFAAGAVGLVVIAGVALSVLSARSKKPPELEPPQVTVAQPEPPVEVAIDEPEEVALLSTIKFTVSTTPIGAAVFLGDKQLGRTPVVLRGDVVDGSDVTLRVELQGFHPAEVKTALVPGGRVDLDLESTTPTVDPNAQHQQRRDPQSIDEMLEISRRLRESGQFGASPTAQ